MVRIWYERNYCYMKLSNTNICEQINANYSISYVNSAYIVVQK